MPVPAAATPAAPGPVIPPDVLRELTVHRDWVSSWWTVVVPAVLLVVLLGVLVRRSVLRRRARRAGTAPRRRVRSRLVTATGWTGVVGLVLVTGLAAVNVVSGVVPSTHGLRLLATDLGILPAPAHHRWTPQAKDATATTGRLEDVTIPGEPGQGMAEQDTWVYTPPGYDEDTTARYPVVYLVHGSPGQGSYWFTGGDADTAMDVLVRHHLVPPMIVVGVQANSSDDVNNLDNECLDSTTGGAQVESYLTRTVVAWTDAHLRTLPDREDRVLGGMSSGGYCALNLGLRHTDVYGSILAFEPYGEPGDGPDGRPQLRDQAEYDANSPTTYLPTLDLPRPVPVFLDEGSEAPAEEKAMLAGLRDTLVARGQDVVLREEEGTSHDWRTVAAGLPYALVFAAQHLPGGAGG